MKRFFNRTLIGVKRGLFTPTLPPEILEFQKKPLVRLFRIIGGLSFLIILGRDHMSFFSAFFNLSLFYLSYFFAVLFFLYHLYISYHRFKHTKYLLKSGALDYRNSPLDKYITMLGRVLVCAKSTCDAATPFGLGLGLMLGADQALKEVGKEAFFGPILGSGLVKILPKDDLDHWRDAYLESTRNLRNASKYDNLIKEFLKETPDLEGVSNEDKTDLLELLTELKYTSAVDLELAKNQAIQILEEKSKK
jgi:hypothetical protein